VMVPQVAARSAVTTSRPLIERNWSPEAHA